MYTESAYMLFREERGERKRKFESRVSRAELLSDCGPIRTADARKMSTIFEPVGKARACNGAIASDLSRTRGDPGLEDIVHVPLDQLQPHVLDERDAALHVVRATRGAAARSRVENRSSAS